MGVENPNKKRSSSSRSGQSVLEFLFMLPIVLAIVMIMVRMNTAIQMSIVNQQYTRARLLFLSFNSAVYPEIKYQQDQIGKQMNQMVGGISENSGVGGDSGISYSPAASTQLVTRSKIVTGPNEPQTEPKTRALVRIRNTATLCTPIYYMYNQGAAVSTVDQTKNVVTAYNLDTNSQLNDFCRSQIQYE